jgi:hypothetical protein
MAQLPFVVLASVAIASWCRFAGASRPTSLALGSSFILMTPVWLQSMHTQVDIACAALFLSTTRLLVEPPTRGRFLAVACAMGLYVGTKFTGALHLVVLTPWIFFWAWPLGLGWALSRAAALISGLGAARYLINVLIHGNPFWPFSMRVPFLGVIFGPIDPGAINLAPPHSSGAFFTAPHSIDFILWSWFHDDSALWPDVRSGGFGLVFRWLLVPALLLLVIDVLRRRPNLHRALPIVAVCILALVVPMPWWPRYTLAAGGMGLVALATLLRAERHWLIGSFFIALIVAGWVNTISVLREWDAAEYHWPGKVLAMARATPRERERADVTTWLWPPQMIDARDAQFADGGVLLYDESADFMSEFFARGLRNTPRFQSSANAGEFVRAVSETGACWAMVHEHSPADAAAQRLRWQLLFPVPRTNGRMWKTGLCR